MEGLVGWCMCCLGCQAQMAGARQQSSWLGKLGQWVMRIGSDLGDSKEGRARVRLLSEVDVSMGYAGVRVFWKGHRKVLQG
jgi:hypothetical protein